MFGPGNEMDRTCAFLALVIASAPGCGSEEGNDASGSNAGSTSGSGGSGGSASYQWTANVRVNDDATPEQQREVSLAVDSSSNWYAGWMDLRQGVSELNYCAFAASSDGGQTFAQNELYKGPFNVCGDPVVTADRSGNLYRMVVAADFELAPEVNPVRSEIQLARSSDGGKTWGQWQTVVEPNPAGPVPPEGVNDKPWVAADGDHVVVVWTILPDHYLDGDLMITQSADGGATWGEATQIGQGIGACVVIDEAQRIHVAWGRDLSGVGSGGTVHYRSSSDGGVQWSDVRDVADTGTGGLPDDTSLIIGCATDRAGDNVYLSWTGNRDGTSLDTWVAHSPDAGATWDAPVRVNDDAGDARQTRGWIGVDGTGQVHAAWIDYRSGSARAYASRSRDQGHTWDDNEIISDGDGVDSAQDYNGLAISPEDEVGFAWTDDRDRETGMDVYFTKRIVVR